MERLTQRRRFFAVLFITALLSPFGTREASAGSPALALRNHAPAAPHLCDVAWQDGKGQVKDLIRCVARRWDVPGGPERAIAVARCESGLRPKALNPTGCAGYGCRGLFQAHMHYWRDWWARWVRRYGLPDNPYNARSNVVWAIKMAHVEGWDPWGCG